MELTQLTEAHREIENLLDEGGPLAQAEIRAIIRRVKGLFGIDEANRTIDDYHLEGIGIRKFESWK